MTALASPPALRSSAPSRGVVTAPLPGESQAEFAERYHSTMARAIPETDRRNVEMMRCWKQSGAGADLDRSAAQRFTQAEYLHVPNVPVFAEHTTKDSRGNVVVYDRRALAAIVDRCNDRILDTGDFPPLTEGHTPTPEELTAGRKMPDVLGYAGPFRLGLIGNVNPRWAIFCDEWHHRDAVDRLRKLQRRSPEVWLEERMEDRFLDPIAALGAETPRLDLGTARFGRRGDGRIVEKYSGASVAPATAGVPTATGANTTYLPGGTGKKKTDRKDRYEGDGNMVSPEDVQQIVDAVTSSKPMAFLIENMPRLEAMLASAPAAGDASPMGAGPGAEGGLPPAGPPAPLGAPPGPPMPAGPLAGPPGPLPGAGPGMGPPPDAGPPEALDDGPPEPAGDLDDSDAGDADYEPDDEDREQFRRYMSGECSDDDMKQYKAGKRFRRRRRYQADPAAGSAADAEKPSGEGDVSTPATETKPAPGKVAEPSIAKFSRAGSAGRGETVSATMTQRERVEQARYQKLQDEVAQLRRERDAEKLERRKAERYSKLSELRQHFSFELDEEAADTADLSDQQFERHLDRIVSRYQRIPLGTRLHVPASVEPSIRDKDGGRRRPTETEVAKAMDVATRYQRRGEHVSFDEALDIARKEGAETTVVKTA